MIAYISTIQRPFYSKIKYIPLYIRLNDLNYNVFHALCCWCFAQFHLMPVLLSVFPLLWSAYFTFHSSELERDEMT